MKPFISSRVAEIIFALAFAYLGFAHIKNAASVASGAPGWLPGDSKLYIYIIGAVFILAAITIIANKYKTLGCYLLAAVLIVFVFALHVKDFGTDPSGFLEGLAMAMGAIIIGNRGTTNWLGRSK